MSISSKFKKYVSIVGSSCIVYQPGRVGSTGVTNTAKSVFGADKVIHLHSAGFDRVYCIKRPIIYSYINYFLAKILKVLLSMKRFFTGSKTLILVPMRDVNARNRSVFIEYFELLVAQAREEVWYRELYKGSQAVFIKKVFDELLEKDGFELWVANELKAFIGSRSEEIAIPPIENIIIETYSSRICIFDVKNGADVLLQELGVKSLESRTENTGSSKWCFDFISNIDELNK